MKLYCGIDLHANNSVISVQDVQYEKRLPNDLGVIVTAMQSFQKELQLQRVLAGRQSGRG
jgi:hypothetical protein